MHWQTEAGKAAELREWAGKPVVLALAYTRCGTSCPRTVETLKRLQKSLTDSHLAVEVVVVSLDPEHDTPARLASYRKEHQVSAENWHFLTGSLGDTRMLANLLGFRFSKNAESGEVTHDNKLYLLSPDGSLLGSVKSLDAEPSEVIAILKAGSEKAGGTGGHGA
jgi:protein SCO1/2